MTTGAQGIATRYIACWNERDAERRRALLAELWTEDTVYADPIMRSEGRAGIGALIENVQARFPEFRFVPKGRADGPGRRPRRLRPLLLVARPGGRRGGGGREDSAVVSTDGRLRGVTGFLDRVPPRQG